MQSDMYACKYRSRCQGKLEYIASLSSSCLTSHESAKGRTNGARQPSRYFLFHIPIVLEKKFHLVHYGKFAKGYEKVVVTEVGASSDVQQYSDVGVLAGQRR